MCFKRWNKLLIDNWVCRLIILCRRSYLSSFLYPNCHHLYDHLYSFIASDSSLASFRYFFVKKLIKLVFSNQRLDLILQFSTFIHGESIIFIKSTFLPIGLSIIREKPRSLDISTVAKMLELDSDKGVKLTYTSFGGSLYFFCFPFFLSCVKSSLFSF